MVPAAAPDPQPASAGTGHPVDRDPWVKVLCGTLFLYFHMTFHHWRERSGPLSRLGREMFTDAPAPLLEPLQWIHFLDLFQIRTWLYLQGLVALAGLFSLFHSRAGRMVPWLLSWLFANKLWFYLTDFRLFTNYHHFHLLFTLVFLLTRGSLRAFRATLAVAYVLSGLVKLSPSWLHGDYFNSLPERLPLLPRTDGVVTAACLAVVVLEFLGPIAWFTRWTPARRLTFAAFLVFHLYSGVIVGFWYTTLMLPLVAVAFRGFDRPLLDGYRFAPRHLPALAVLAVSLAAGLVHFAIPGDARLTSEGRYLGMFMFDARHSVRFQATVRRGDRMWIFQVRRNWKPEGGGPAPDADIRCAILENGREIESFFVHGPVRHEGAVILNPEYFTSARMRISGDPYLYYRYARELVRRFRPDHVSIRLDERLDGREEFVTLLDIPDFEALSPTWRLLGHNPWIRLPGPETPSAYRWP